MTARGAVVVAMASAWALAGCILPNDCAPRCAEYRYGEHATLRTCQYRRWDEPCDEPWTIELADAFGAPFRGLGAIEEVSVPAESGSWIMARRPSVDDSPSRYLVYDLVTRTYAYEGTRYDVAQEEWLHRNGVVPARDVMYPILVDPYGLDDHVELGHFTPTWGTTLRWWPLWLPAGLATSLVAWRIRRRRRR